MSRGNWLALIVSGLVIALAITLFSPWASSSPDGLERVAEDEGFLEEARDPSYEVIPDYAFPGVENERLATVLAGITGVLIVAGVVFVAGILLQNVARSRTAARTAPHERTPGTSA